MGDEPQNDTTPPGGSLSWLVWTIFLFLVVYPLSVGPAAKICGPSPPAPVRAIYAPLAYLSDHSRSVRSFYDWYAKLWGTRL